MCLTPAVLSPIPEKDLPHGGGIFTLAQFPRLQSSMADKAWQSRAVHTSSHQCLERMSGPDCFLFSSFILPGPSTLGCIGSPPLVNPPWKHPQR